MKPKTATHQQRLGLLQSFLSAHDIRFADIAEQFSAVAGKDLEPSQARTMLFRNLTMRKPYRDCLLDLGFPASVLPPERVTTH